MEGTAKESELIELKESYIAYKCSRGDPLCEFDDSEGTSIIDFREVQAISINNFIEDKLIGYKS